MAAAAIINLHNRRLPLYSEVTTRTFVQMDLAVPEHLPLIRAAGYVSPPPATPRSHDVDYMIADIAVHMARSDQPQTPHQVFEALQQHHDELNRWPQFHVTLFIHHTAGIMPDDQGNYHPNQPWGIFISGQQLVSSTSFRILKRDQRPATTDYLVDEVERLVGSVLPDGYNTGNAVRHFAYRSEDVYTLGKSIFGLTEWTNDATARNVRRRGSRTDNRIHAFLVENGSAHVEDIIEHVQRRQASSGERFRTQSTATAGTVSSGSPTEESPQTQFWTGTAVSRACSWWCRTKSNTNHLPSCGSPNSRGSRATSKDSTSWSRRCRPL